MKRNIIITVAIFFFVTVISLSFMIYQSAMYTSARTPTPTPTPTKTPQAPLSTLTEFERLGLLVEDVRAASKYKYNAKDTLGNNLDAVKVIQPTTARKYLAVYHTNVNNVFTVKLAESTDLVIWNFKTNIDTNATHADIMTFPEGDFLVTYEKFTSTSSSINIRHYKNYDNLIKGQFLSEKIIPRLLSNSNEGTPNFISVVKKPFNKSRGTQDWSASTIKLGFHYYDSVTDKNATGTLTNWTSWNATANTTVNDYFNGIGYAGNYGDRDDFKYKFTNSVNGTQDYNIYEAQITKDAWNSWRTFLYDVKNNKFQQLDPYTHKRSISFGNPSVTVLTLPDGSNGFFVSYYVFSEGSAAGEAGSLIFFTKESNLSKVTLRENRDPILPTTTPTPTSSQIISPIASATPTPTNSPVSPTENPFNTPAPTTSQITCTCTQPGGSMPNNGFSCSDGDSRYCAPDEHCTTSSIKPAWPCAK